MELEIPIWPIGMVFGEGEGICFTIAGHDLKLPELERFGFREELLDKNKGKHKIYSGSIRSSFLMLPVIEG